jgi:hypothetical protein
MPRSSSTSEIHLGGSHLTRKCAETEGRPCLVVRICRIETGYEEFVEPVAQWLMAVNPAVLNVAGNRESIPPAFRNTSPSSLLAPLPALG